MAQVSDEKQYKSNEKSKQKKYEEEDDECNCCGGKEGEEGSDDGFEGFFEFDWSVKASVEDAVGDGDDGAKGDDARENDEEEIQGDDCGGVCGELLLKVFGNELEEDG